MDRDPKFKRYCSEEGCPRAKLTATNWLEGISDSGDTEEVEVTFKNTRNGYFLNTSHLPLRIGDIVTVEAAPGHDVGRVSMTGRLVRLQMKKNGFKPDTPMKRVIRIASQADLEKFEQARNREHDTMIKSRKIAEDLDLNMKIGDVEYQGDGGKAIFYYIADERVDFRKLIRVLADTFKIRVEMKQIGARQEAGRIGGIGPCGRPLCCASWMSHFTSVGTGAARQQDLSMNPQKLAGQCAKLKCCLNFETDVYAEALKKIPPKDVPLETLDNTYYYFKPDILARKVTYSTDKKIPANLVTIDAQRAFDVIAMNKEGVKPESLAPDAEEVVQEKEYVDLVEQESLTRFDKSKRRKKQQKRSDEKEKKQNAAPRQQGSNNGNGQGNGNGNGQGNGNGNRKRKQRQERRPGSQDQKQNVPKEQREPKESRKPKEPREPKGQ